MVQLAPIPKQFLDSSGVPYAGGEVDVFYAGDTRRANVYADSEGKTIIQNPVILDSHGSWKGFVEMEPSLDYVIRSKEGNVVFFFPNVSVLKKGSIGRYSLKNAANLVPDERFFDFHKLGSDVILSFNDSMKTWLKENGFEFED